MRAKAKMQTAIVTSRPMTTLKTLVKWVSCLLTMPSAERAELAAKYSRGAVGNVNKRARPEAAQHWAGSLKWRRQEAPRSGSAGLQRRVQHLQGVTHLRVLTTGAVDLLLRVDAPA